MSNLARFMAIIEFLGDGITEEQSARLMDEARSELSIIEMQELKEHCSGALYTDLSMYEGEMGGFDRY